MAIGRAWTWMSRSGLAVTLFAGLGLQASGPAAAQTTSEALAYPLEGTRWRVSEYLHEGVERPPGPEVTALLQLGDGRVRGFDGCSRLRGRYETAPAGSPQGRDRAPSSAPAPSTAAVPATVPAASGQAFAGDARLAIRGLRRGARSCAEQTMLVVEGLHDGLARTASYRLVPADPPWRTTLELLDEAGQTVLRLAVDDAGSLPAMIWMLESVDGAPARDIGDGQPATLLFDAGTRLGREGQAVRERLEAEGRVERERRRVLGSTGCAAFDGSYILTGRVVSIADLTSETEPCPPSLAAQEVTVLDILDATSLTVTLPPGRLELRSDEDGRTLTYRASATLEEQQWVLDRRAGRRLAPDEVVTLFLVPDDATGHVRSGTISGEGPCGTYGGTYRTDGLLVRVETLDGSPDPCRDRGRERRYLRALRKATFADLRGLELSLLDDQGQPLLTFTTPGSL